MSIGRLCIAGLAALGLAGAPTAAQQGNTSRVVGVAKGGQQTTREIEQDMFGGIGPSLARGLLSGGGCPPDIWGRSRACARMVRKNRILARRASK
jgi:hypothetical protein